jgi:hypothetical protein
MLLLDTVDEYGPCIRTYAAGTAIQWRLARFVAGGVAACAAETYKGQLAERPSSLNPDECDEQRNSNDS